jgi:glycosyltransferase involved in cell wall biosynthesis
MKILFICGALEPGKDGVGDYTRRLAGAVQSLGQQSSIIALCDPYVAEETVANQSAENNTIPVLRISANTGDIDRYRRAREWADAFEPVWISLQFVPYSFSPKGLPFNLARQLKTELVKKRRLHIMFHEIWVGLENNFDWKRGLTSLLQKNIIRQLINTLHPAIIHTQLPLAQRNLETMVQHIQPLPLFSNIDVFNQPLQPDNNVIRVGFFSQAAASAPILSFVEILCSNARAAGNSVELYFIGGNPARMRETGEMINKKGLFNKISYTGFLNPEGISAALQQCSLGITQVPRHALGKSGSVAAFLHHGIPVAAPVVHPGKDQKDIGFFSAALRDAIVLSPRIQALDTAKKAVEKAKHEIGLQVIANLFLESIQSHMSMHH